MQAVAVILNGFFKFRQAVLSMTRIESLQPQMTCVSSSAEVERSNVGLILFFNLMTLQRIKLRNVLAQKHDGI